MIYPEMREDYYPKTWDSAEYDTQLNILLDTSSYLAATEEGFVRLTLLEKIGQVLKGLLGGTNHSAEKRIQAAWLKFLYYGEAQGFLKEKQLQQLLQHVTYSPEPIHPAIKSLFNQIHDYHLNWNKVSESDHFKQLRDIVSDYHRQHASSLRPGLWRRLFIPPILPAEKLFDFGDTHYLLSQRALEQEKPNPRLAFTHLRKAFAIKNDAWRFQQKLAKELENLEGAYGAQLPERKIVQDLWITLAKTAFKIGKPDEATIYLEKALKADSSQVEGLLEVGKVYLMHKQYQSAQPFLVELQKAFPRDLLLQTEIGNAYWHAAKFQEAALVYQTVLNSNQNSAQKSSSHDKQKAFLYNRLGTAYLQNLILPGPNNLETSISLFTKAVASDKNVLEYQENLFQAYDQQMQASPATFAASYGQDWLKFLAICEPSLISQKADKIKSILFLCAEQFFQAHQNKKAHACLETILNLFADQVELKIQALDLAIRFHDWLPLESQFDNWESEHYGNPYLKKKIADAYWDTKKNLALKTYLNALDLLNQQLPLCQDKERVNCQRHIAEIQVKIGQDQVKAQHGLLKNAPHDEGLKRLETAYSLNPEHAPTLFEAYLLAAQAEKQRNKFMRDMNKIISYYQKAFQTLLQKGEYLVELLQLCLDAQRHDDAVKLYYDIQQQSWSQELVLPAALFSQLAQQLYEKKDYEATLACLKQAYKQEPDNKDYKKDYFDFAFALAEDKYTKIQESKEKNEEVYIKELLKLTEILKDCWKAGFQNLEKKKPAYAQILSQIYASLARCYVQRCWMPFPASEYKEPFEKEQIQQHQKEHQKDIQKALFCYDAGLRYQPNNAALHFDKGALLEWNGKLADAIKEFESAIESADKSKDRNPFYHKLFALLCVSVRADRESKEKHMKLADKCEHPDFAENYPIWRNEFMCSEKTKSIDPHTYTSKKGWYS